MNKYLSISPEVEAALAAGKPVVALESTIISHGMPYPQNVQTAMRVEQTIRDNGAVPATIAIIGGRLKAGLSAEEIEYLGKKGQEVIKASRRDLPVLVARGDDGATTVATTMIIAAMAGIKVFATGGIGGVHRGAETTMDISADLEELAGTPVMVVCAGAKAILDLGLTLEYLETKGVPVIGFGTDELPAFYTRKSGLGVDYRIDTEAGLAAAFRAKLDMGLKGGMLVTNPIPEEYSMDPEYINKVIDDAVAEADRLGIHGKKVTPFLLAKVAEITGGDSLEANIRLVLNNAAVAARAASHLAGRDLFVRMLPPTEDPAAIPALFADAGIEYHKVDCVNWPGDYPYCPDVRFGIAHDCGNILLHYKVREQSVLAAGGNDKDHMWEDSCMEFFCAPGEDDTYINVEANCIGRIYSCIGPNRNERTFLPDSAYAGIKRWASLGNARIVPERKEETEWELALIIPASTYGLDGLAGRTLRGNIYKCGDKLSVPHFVSWGAIGTPKPDFHRPDWFVKLKFEGAEEI